MSDAVPAARLGAAADFSLGVEEELIMVGPETHALAHTGVELLDALDERASATGTRRQPWLAG